MRINDIVVLENNKRYILTNKYELNNNIYYLAYELLDNEKTDKFVFVKEVYDDDYYVILEKNEKRYIYSGEKTISGNGKNAKETNYVQVIDENGFLPVDVKIG